MANHEGRCEKSMKVISFMDFFPGCTSKFRYGVLSSRQQTNRTIILERMIGAVSQRHILPPIDMVIQLTPKSMQRLFLSDGLQLFDWSTSVSLVVLYQPSRIALSCLVYPKTKRNQVSPSHQIFSCIHRALNIDKNKN